MGRGISSQAAEFFICHRIMIFSRNFVEVKNLPAISMIFDLLKYFYHQKNQTELQKAVCFTNSCRNMAQS